MRRKWFAIPIACILSLCIGFQPIAAEESEDYQNFADEGVIVEIEEISEPEPIAIDDENSPVRVGMEQGQPIAELNEMDAVSEEDDTVSDSGFPGASAPYSAAAATYDLAIQNLEVEGSEPFPYDSYTNFKVYAANLGTQSISNVKLSIYIDGNFNSSGTLGTLAAGSGVIATVPIIGLAGTHEIEFCVEASGISESNTSNNSILREFVWEDWIDLDIWNLTHESPIRCLEPESMSFYVANYGNLSVNQALVRFQVGNTQPIETRVDLPAYTRITLHVNVIFQRCGSIAIVMQIDPEQEVNDMHRTNNESHTALSVHADVERSLGRYSSEDASAINIAIAPSADELFDGEGKHISYGDAYTALREWNNIVDGVNISLITPVDTETPPFPDYHVVVAKVHSDREDDIAFTETPVNGVFSVTQRRLELNDYYFDGGDTDIGEFTQDMMLRTLTHEVGHVWGLAHPSDQCQNESIMRTSSYLPSGLATYEIVQHDIENLAYIYEGVE